MHRARTLCVIGIACFPWTSVLGATCDIKEYAQYKDEAAQGAFNRKIMATLYCTTRELVSLERDIAIRKGKDGTFPLSELLKEADQCNKKAEMISDAIRSTESKLPASQQTDLSCSDSPTLKPPK